MNTDGAPRDPLTCTYEIGYGVKWGAKQDAGGHMDRITLKEMNRNEYDKVLETFRKDYTRAGFIKV